MRLIWMLLIMVGVARLVVIGVEYAASDTAARSVSIRFDAVTIPGRGVALRVVRVPSEDALDDQR